VLYGEGARVIARLVFIRLSDPIWCVAVGNIRREWKIRAYENLPRDAAQLRVFGG
jgi:hypothetical protein